MWCPNVSLWVFALVLLWELAECKKKKSSSGSRRIAGDEEFFKRWNSFKEIEAFVGMLAKKFKSTGLVKLTSIGKSAEHRHLSLLSVGPSKPKYQLMMMGAMHGREWITPHAVIYTAMNILNGIHSKDEKVVRLLQETQIHFLPMLNPDGYEFTRIPATKSPDARQWRKNRRSLCSKCDRAVHGIDLNRNWGIKGKSWGFGADRATSEVYQGKHPFSEPEIAAVRDWLLKGGRGSKINGFFDVHCCSGAILPPFYYKGESEELQKANLANCGKIAKAMKAVNGIRYKHRPREKVFSDSNTGIGADWIYAEGKVQNVFIVETRGNKTKLLKDIFEVPEQQIIPISAELEAGFWKLAELVTPFGNDEDAKVDDIAVGQSQATSVLAVTNELAPVQESAPLDVRPSEMRKVPSNLNIDDLLSSLGAGLSTEPQTSEPKQQEVVEESGSEPQVIEEQVSEGQDLVLDVEETLSLDGDDIISQEGDENLESGLGNVDIVKAAEKKNDQDSVLELDFGLATPDANEDDPPEEITVEEVTDESKVVDKGDFLPLESMGGLVETPSNKQEYEIETEETPFEVEEVIDEIPVEVEKAPERTPVKTEEIPMEAETKLGDPLEQGEEEPGETVELDSHENDAVDEITELFAQKLDADAYEDADEFEKVADQLLGVDGKKDESDEGKHLRQKYRKMLHEIDPEKLHKLHRNRFLTIEYDTPNTSRGLACVVVCVLVIAVLLHYQRKHKKWHYRAD
mmetsp:Transcript_3075/g.5816  ORF Transcript_3075/g.5816 Transcript_3075/m.5816 type:complete len:743 (-) Transcript_3075:1709-3937(-)